MIENRSLTEEEFFNLKLEDVYIVDVRNSFEQATGYLGIAHNIPFSDIIQIPNMLPKDKIILTYCNYGNRAGRSASTLREKGFRAYSIGGYSLFSEKLKKRCKK